MVASATSTPTSTTVVPDENVQIAVAEARHFGVTIRCAHPAVHETDAERREQLSEAFLLGLGGGALVHLRLLDERDDDERPMPDGRLFAHLLPRPIEVAASADAGPDRQPAGRRRAQVRDVKVRIEDLAQGARDRRGGHQEHVGRGTMRLRLELVALFDAEAVLLVDDHEAEVGEGDALLEQRVGADDEWRHAGRERLPRGRRAAAAHRTGQQDDVEREVGQQVRQGRVVLARQQVGRREERGLATGKPGGGQCVGGHGGLARPDVALQQPEHRHGPREVGGDVAHGRALVGGELDRSFVLAAKGRGERVADLPVALSRDLDRRRPTPRRAAAAVRPSRSGAREARRRRGVAGPHRVPRTSPGSAPRRWQS